MSDSPQIPAPAETAAADPMAGVPAGLAAAMRRRGFEALTSVQRAVLDADPGTRDLRISSQTGSGKTVAIGLALAGHLAAGTETDRRDRPGPSVLVLVPTRELAMQVREELAWLLASIEGLAVEVVMGGTSLAQERRALERRPLLLIGTPGRTLDHLKTGALVCDGVSHVVLDESDRMLDMGFREELEAILETLPQPHRTHLISATFPAGVRRLADRFQREPLHVEGTRLGAANVDIEHVAHVVDPRDRHAALVNLLLLNEGGRCLIFVERRIDASSLAARLSAAGFPVQAFSGELAQAQRTRTIDAFRDGSIRTLVSTDVAARGIDVPDIELVIHADSPADADTYVHRSGRTGRAGRRGRSVVLVSPRARTWMARLLRTAAIEADWRPAPAAGLVRKQLRKRFRRELHARLGSEEMPTQAQIDHAKGLLDGRDPAAVVALLIEMAQPTPACPPMEVREPAVHERSGPGDAAQGFVRFTINWGERRGAAPNRLLGHVCRRGQIRGHLVGAIDIGPDASSFDVDASVAARFEKLVRRPDARDPGLRITRAGGQGRARGRREPHSRRPGPRTQARPGPARRDPPER